MLHDRRLGSPHIQMSTEIGEHAGHQLIAVARARRRAYNDTPESKMKCRPLRYACGTARDARILAACLSASYDMVVHAAGPPEAAPCQPLYQVFTPKSNPKSGPRSAAACGPRAARRSAGGSALSSRRLCRCGRRGLGGPGGGLRGFTRQALVAGRGWRGWLLRCRGGRGRLGARSSGLGAGGGRLCACRRRLGAGSRRLCACGGGLRARDCRGRLGARGGGLGARGGWLRARGCRGRLGARSCGLGAGSGRLRARGCRRWFGARGRRWRLCARSGLCASSRRLCACSVCRRLRPSGRRLGARSGGLCACGCRRRLGASSGRLCARGRRLRAGCGRLCTRGRGRRLCALSGRLRACRRRLCACGRDGRLRGRGGGLCGRLGGSRGVREHPARRVAASGHVSKAAACAFEQAAHVTLTPCESMRSSGCRTCHPGCEGSLGRTGRTAQGRSSSPSAPRQRSPQHSTTPRQILQPASPACVLHARASTA